MKLLKVFISILILEIVLFSRFCWPVGPALMGNPVFFPGEPSAGMSEIQPQLFDVMTILMGKNPPWSSEDIPGLNGILQPSSEGGDEWLFPGTAKVGGIDSGEGLLPEFEQTVWEKIQQAIEDLLSYFRPQNIPDRSLDKSSEAHADPISEALGEAEKNTTKTGSSWLEDSDSEKERSAYNQREAVRFLKRQREEEKERSLFAKGQEDESELDEMTISADRTGMKNESANSPGTTKIYGRSVPGMVSLPGGGPTEKRARTDSSEQNEDAPARPLGSTASHDDVMRERGNLGKATITFENGRMVETQTLPLPTNINQAYNMAPDTVKGAGVAAAFPQSTLSIEKFGPRQKAIMDATTPMEIPVGLVHQYSALEEYHLDIIVDDSGSMSSKDSGLSYSSEGWPQLSRMEELKHRLHAMSELLSLVAARGISFRKLSDYNNPTYISGEQDHTLIAFQLKEVIETLSPKGTTPLNSAVMKSFDEASKQGRRTIVYVFTDGEPSDHGMLTPAKSFKNTIETIRKKKEAAFFPIGLMACTDNELCIRWMNELDEDFENVQVLDDYFSEKKEVYDHHGGLLPYTYGMYVTAGLLGPIVPLLDNMDESKIYQKSELEDLLGYRTTQEQYEEYRSQAEQARKSKDNRSRSSSHPLDSINRMPIEVDGRRLYRVVDGFVHPHELSQTDPSLSCTIL